MVRGLREKEEEKDKHKTIGITDTREPVCLQQLILEDYIVGQC